MKGSRHHRRIVPGASFDEAAAYYHGSGTTTRQWPLADQLGSVVAYANASGAAANINTYDEYGRPGSGNAEFLQYTGQLAIASAPGVYNYRNRFYQADVGRFLQTDPIVYGDGLNLYSYVQNDPSNFTDPSGEWAWFIIGAISSGAINYGVQAANSGWDWNPSTKDWGSIGQSALTGALFGHAGALTNAARTGTLSWVSGGLQRVSGWPGIGLKTTSAALDQTGRIALGTYGTTLGLSTAAVSGLARGEDPRGSVVGRALDLIMGTSGIFQFGIERIWDRLLNPAQLPPRPLPSPSTPDLPYYPPIELPESPPTIPTRPPEVGRL